MKFFIARLTLALLLISTVFSSSAQSDYIRNLAPDIYYLKYSPFEFTPSIGILEVHVESVDKKKTRKYVKKFNEKGMLSEYYEVKDNDSIKKRAMLFYDKDFQLTSVDFYKRKKNEIDNQIIFEYNAKKQITLMQRLKDDGSIKRESICKYNDSGCLDTRTDSKKNSTEIGNTLKNEYYDSCKRSKSILYDSKGKIKEEWNYMCDETGVRETKKNQTLICSWHESTADVLSMVYESVDDKGRVIKTIGRYTATDTLILEWERYNHDGELSYKYTFDKDFNKMLTYVHYKKGKVKSTGTWTYTDNLLTSISTIRKEKLRSKREYVYDSEKKLTAYNEYGKKGKIIAKYLLTYP
jgi:antitoxin component YwqK of YwqJK toxin-antitoxin module